MEFSYQFGDGDYLYEPEFDDEDEAIKSVLGYMDKEVLIDLLVNKLDVREDLLDILESDIRDELEDNAYQAWKQEKAEDKEKKDWYGTKRNVIGV